MLSARARSARSWSASRRSSASPTGSRFTGALPHDAARAELARGHVHVMPSVHDGFGVAHVEAMAAGLPTIGGEGTGVGGHRRGGGGDAARARPATSRGCARDLTACWSDPAERERLGEAARRTVAEHFTWERCGEATLAVYRSVLG